MPSVSLGQFLGSPEELNIFLKQELEHFAIGRAVSKLEWPSHTVTVAGIKLHSTAAYKPTAPTNKNNPKPSSTTLQGGNLYNTELQEHASEFRMYRNYLDTWKQIGAQSGGKINAGTIVETAFKEAVVGAYALNGETALQGAITDDNIYIAENIRALTDPVDTSGKPDQLVQFVLKAISDLMLRRGGSKYKSIDDLSIGEGNSASPFKVIVPLPVMNALSSLFEVFNIVIPYNGPGNTGLARTPDINILSQIFKGADVIVPQSIQVMNEALYYEDGNPEFVFSGNHISVLYTDPDPMRPSALVYHETPMEIDDETNIFRDKIQIFQRSQLEVKQNNLMIRIDDVLSPELYNQFVPTV